MHYKNNKKILKIAVVGHTNTGKTSLIRMLLRDFEFGEIKNAPSTTIDVAEICLDNPILSLIFTDTPGFEDPIGIADTLDHYFPLTSKLQRTKRIEDFIAEAANYPQFEQEIKILKAVMRADCAFYVVDTRENILGKYEEELALLMQCSLPVLPILNFTHAPDSKVAEWESTLRTLSLHHYLSFDTIFPPKERRLYEKLASLLNHHYDAIHQFLIFRETEDAARYDFAISQLSEFLIEIVTLHIQCEQGVEDVVIKQRLGACVIELENRFSSALLTRYQFKEEDLKLYPLPIKKLEPSLDFFSTDSLLTMSERFGVGAATGASIGVTADAFVGFTSLGIASVLGGLVGGVGNTLRHYVHQLHAHFNHLEIYCLETPLVLHIFERMFSLVIHLEGRSHADTQVIEMNAPIAAEHIKFDTDRLLPLIKKIQSKPEFSSLNSGFHSSKAWIKLRKTVKEIISDTYKN